MSEKDKSVKISDLEKWKDKTQNVYQTWWNFLKNKFKFNVDYFGIK